MRRNLILAIRRAVREQMPDRIDSPPQSLIAEVMKDCPSTYETSNAVYRLYTRKDLVRVADHELTAERCATKKPPGQRRQSAATDQDIAVIRGNNVVINRTEDSGSRPEAVRWALREGRLSEEFAAEVREREAAGQNLLTSSVHAATHVPARVVKAYRNPGEARLQYVTTVGSLKLLKNRDHQIARAMDILEADDGSKNFYACVPFERGGIPDQPCADKFGVLLGRFQILLFVDAGEYFIPGYSHTARPKDSYRQQDILSALHGIFRTHGVWDECRFERGSFEGNAVQAALHKVGARLHTVFTPRAKAFVEGMFNVLWTKTSHLPGQIGRFRGETEEEYSLVMKCRRGTEDPRKIFPMLAPTLSALDTAVIERNRTWVESPEYGKWIPEDRFALRKNMGSGQPWDDSADYLFRPCSEVRRIVNGKVKATVPFMHWEDPDGTSHQVPIQFTWGSTEMGNLDGQDVRIFFDPFAPDCSATVVVLDKQGRPGEVLCQAPQLSAMARHAREGFGFHVDEDNGIDTLKSGHHALRQDVRTFLPGGKPGIQSVEIRTGDGRTSRLEVGSAGAAGGASVPASHPAPARTVAAQRLQTRREQADQAADIILRRRVLAEPELVEY